MNNKSSNEKKLLRNLETIIKNYVKVDNELLEVLSKNDIDKFKEIIGSKSSDNFLDIIVDEYTNFTKELFDKLLNIHESNIEIMRDEQKRLKEFQSVKGKNISTKKVKTKSYKAIKFKKNIWTNKEKNFIERMIKSNVKSGIIIKKLNEKRNSEGLVSRTNSSVYNQINRIKKEETDEEKD